MARENAARLRIAIIGTGISGLSAAWLLSQRHDVSVYELAPRVGGHSNTVIVADGENRVPVDTGFIVYNTATYPNLMALFDHLEVPTELSEMSFAVSLDNGGTEYSGTDLSGLFAQRRNLVRPRFWSMLGDLRRFYREAPRDLSFLDERTSLGQYLDVGGYGVAFRQDHLLPMASAIWSASPSEILQYPAASFIRFHDNHGLLKLTERPPWRTVVGGCRSYVDRLTRRFADRIALNARVTAVRRLADGVEVREHSGLVRNFDHAVIATHADQALALLADPTPGEIQLLGRFRYSQNLAVLHSDARLMPRRRGAWASWNYIGASAAAETKKVQVTYWMNRLQNLPTDKQLFVTLNPACSPRPETILHSEMYEHPLFDAAAVAAQRKLWALQGSRHTWFCGAYFGAGFHEDGLQSGLAVAEALGGVRRPWTVADESSRITLPPGAAARAAESIVA